MVILELLEEFILHTNMNQKHVTDFLLLSLSAPVKPESTHQRITCSI